MKVSRWLVWAALLASNSGCADKQLQPVMVSSAGMPGYAVGYPSRLQAELALLDADRKQAAELPPSLPARAREFKPGPDPRLLPLIVRQADEAGRSEAYDATYAEVMGLQAFWNEERGSITARANGAAQKQIAEAGCTQHVELGGPIGYALKDGVDRELEKRLRGVNEAHRTIERQKGALGTANTAAAKQLADDVARSSYLVYVALVEERDAIQRLLAERPDIDATLEAAVEFEHSYQQSSAPAAEKKASQERLAAIESSRAAIPGLVAAAEAAIKDIDRQIEDRRALHETALERLESELQAQLTPAQAAAGTRR